MPSLRSIFYEENLYKTDKASRFIAFLAYSAASCAELTAANVAFSGDYLRREFYVRKQFRPVEDLYCKPDSVIDKL